VSFGDRVSFRHFHNLFKSGSVALTYATIHKSRQRATYFFEDSLRFSYMPNPI
jgi:hypothetical protein